MFSLFLQYFGLFCLIGILISVVLIVRENKKLLPTTEERFELEELGLISKEETNKKLLRQQTSILRTYKGFLKHLETLKNDKLNANIENVASDILDIDFENQNK